MSETAWEGPTISWKPALTLPALADRNGRERPHDVILVDAVSGREMTCAQLVVAYHKAARGLAAAGMGRGDCLCTLMPNDLDWYVAALAAQSLGGTISGINPLATLDEIGRQFSRVPAKAVLTVAPLGEAARAVAAAAGIPIVLSTGGGSAEPALVDIDGPEIERRHRCFADDPAMFPFSSGTTGLPKAVVITHRNMVCGGHQMCHALHVGRGDRFLGLAPLFHVVGPCLFACALVSGGAVVVVPRFDPELVFDAIERQRVTHVPLMSPVLRALARHPARRNHDLSHLKVVIASGAPLPKADQIEAAERFGCPVVQVYGMTEAASGITCDEVSAPTPGSAGRPVPLVKLRIVEPETGASLPAGNQGEMQVQGPNIFQGYLGYPAETAKIMTHDGWLKTGDVGVIGSHGRLQITGRIKELIKVNSSQVPPAELEALLAGHPAVAEAAVLGRPNRYAGEMPVAYVVLQMPVDPFEVMDWANERVIHYKRVRAIEVVEALPKNAVGKLDRKALVALDRTRAGKRGGIAA